MIEHLHMLEASAICSSSRCWRTWKWQRHFTNM